MNKKKRIISFCLLKEEDVRPILVRLQTEDPDLQFVIRTSFAILTVEIGLSQNHQRLEIYEQELRKQFGTYFFSEATLEEAIHHKMILERKKLAFAESCTGGALSARIVSVAGASTFFLGSCVVYSDEWKEQILGVSSSTLRVRGAVSRETVEEMIQGLYARTQTDYAVAISGVMGPARLNLDPPVGTLILGVAQRDEIIDLGVLNVPSSHRTEAIEFAVQTALSVLWRRIAYGELTFV